MALGPLININSNYEIYEAQSIADRFLMWVMVELYIAYKGIISYSSERIGWIPAPEDVPQSLVTDYRWIFGLSVTEMEIVHGAYRKDNPNCKLALILPRHITKVGI